VRIFSAQSVQQKLLRVVLLSTFAALLVAITAMVAYDLHVYHRSWIADISTQAELLARTTAPALTFDDARVAKENLALLRGRPKILAGAIYNARGKVFASYAANPGRPLPELPGADGAAIQGNELAVFKRVVDGNEILGTVYLRAEYELYDRLLGYLGIAAVVALGALLVAYFLSRQLQRAVTGPLAAIAGVAQEVTDKRNFALRARKLSEDEIGRLADAFNTMLAEIGRGTTELQGSKEQVLRLNAELEQRVQERTAQLQYTNAELEAFCYSVSHDLRAPLRSIDGFSQALLEDFGSNVPEDGQRYLLRIRSATQRMAQLIEDLLNLSRVSRSALDVRDVDVSEIARHVAADLRAREPARDVELTIWDGIQAKADARLLRAALENLLGNAWKFSSKSAQPRIEFGCLRDAGRATFFVRDNGAGFDMKYADKLFGAFQRLHSVNEFSGTGIGLATVQRIVHRHGGRIWADAQVGSGATFYFTLEPDSTRAEARPAPPAAREAAW
jgi:signal transduction histidine kinase